MAPHFPPHFPIVTQKDLRESKGEKSCSICCVDYADGHIPVRTPCNHIFGQNCLAAWLADNDTCPMCRADITGPLRHQSSSRRDEPSTRSRAGTEVSRAPERSSRPQPSRIETLRHEPSARPRAGTASRTSGAPLRLSVSSSQWHETHLPTGSAHRRSHSRTAREEPSARSSHRDSHISRTAREAPSSSSHRDSHTSRTAREAPPTSSHRSSHTSHTARAASSSHRTHTSRAASNPMTRLASLIRSSHHLSGDEHTAILARSPNLYPAFSRERLMEILQDGYTAQALQDVSSSFPSFSPLQASQE